MIPQTFIEEVQARTDIAEVAAGYLPLKKAGRNFKAQCPFHSEKTPSFIISPQKQIFHCFGCGEGGGVFQFLILMEKVTFPEAVEILAKRAGLDVPYEKSRISRTKTTLYEVVSKAALFFHEEIKREKFRKVREYLYKRGIGDEAINKFYIGYADDNNSLLSYMRKQGVSFEALEKVSLVASGKGGFRDLFRGRITFPIFDVRSRVVAFGARSWGDNAAAPKYVNSSENPLYRKREHLFGLNLSKEDIVKKDNVIVVEGYLDVIAPFMGGVENIVASLGTALTDEQIRLLKRYASCVTLMFDSDSAGKNAVLRSIDSLLENGLNVKVAKIPEGYDPDSLFIKKGREEFLRILEKKTDFFDYKLKELISNYDKESIKGKSKIAYEMLITVDKLNSEIEKYEYIRKLAVGLGVKEEIIISEFQSKFSKKRTKPGNDSLYHSAGNSRGFSDIKIKPLSITEKVILKFMVTNSKAFSLVRKNLKPEHFDSYRARKAASFLFNVSSSLENKNYSPRDLLGLVDDKDVSGFVSEILLDDDIVLDKKFFKESLLKMRKKGVVQAKDLLKERIKEAEAKGDRSRVKELINEYHKINSEVKNG